MGGGGRAPTVNNDPALMSRISSLETLLASERSGREESDRRWREESLRATERVTALSQQLVDQSRLQQQLADSNTTIQRLQQDISGLSRAQDPVAEPVNTEVDDATAAASVAVSRRASETRSRRGRNSLLIPMSGASTGTGLSV